MSKNFGARKTSHRALNLLSRARRPPLRVGYYVAGNRAKLPRFSCRGDNRITDYVTAADRVVHGSCDARPTLAIHCFDHSRGAMTLGGGVFCRLPVEFAHASRRYPPIYFHCTFRSPVAGSRIARGDRYAFWRANRTVGSALSYRTAGVPDRA